MRMLDLQGSWFSFFQMVIRCEAPTIRTGTTLTSKLEEMVPVLIDTLAFASYDHLFLSINYAALLRTVFRMRVKICLWNMRKWRMLIKLKNENKQLRRPIRPV